MLSSFITQVFNCLTLCPTAVILPVQISFSAYGEKMIGRDSMKIAAVAVDQQQEDDIYETETDIILEDPYVSIKVGKTVYKKMFDYTPLEVESVLGEKCYPRHLHFNHGFRWVVRENTSRRVEETYPINIPLVVCFRSLVGLAYTKQ